jgi:RNA 3'-terminal phosphate cyclase
MISVDGAQKSGGGTIVRFAVALAALLNDELHLTNIRAKREKPGLRPQHPQAVEALGEIFRGTFYCTLGRNVQCIWSFSSFHRYEICFIAA